MGVDTKAIIKKGVTPEQIAAALSARWANARVVPTQSDEYFYITLGRSDDYQRNIFVSYSNSSLTDYGIAGVLLSLSCYGESVEILRYLCETFGGYLDENDCDDVGFYAIREDLYEQGDDFTPDEKFRMALMRIVGPGKVSEVFKYACEWAKAKAVQYEK